MIRKSSQQDLYAKIQADNQEANFFLHHKDSDFVAYAKLISNTHIIDAQPLTDKVTKHVIGSTKYDNEMAYVSLKENQSGKPIARFHERKHIYNCGNYVSEDITRVGPAIYYYPNGTVAGIELYSEPNPDNKYINTQNNPKESIYFDPKGHTITQHMFHVHFRKEHKMNLDNLVSYSPQIKSYKELVRDLEIEMTVGGDRFGPQDIREYVLDDAPKAYLDMLATDVKDEILKVFGKKAEEHQDFYNKQMQLYVYGKIEDSVAKRDYFHINDELMGKLGFPSEPTRIDLSYRLPDGSKGITEIFENTEECHDYMRLYKYKDPDGRLKQKILFKEENPSIRVFYYPDGRVMTAEHEDYPNPYCIDSYNSLTCYSKAKKCYDAEWGESPLYLELTCKGNDKQERLINLYETGFDSKVLFMELDGKKVELKDEHLLKKGEHTLKVYLDPEYAITVPENLLKRCNAITDVKVMGDQKNMIKGQEHTFKAQIAGNKIINKLKKNNKGYKPTL